MFTFKKQAFPTQNITLVGNSGLKLKYFELTTNLLPKKSDMKLLNSVFIFGLLYFTVTGSNW